MKIIRALKSDKNLKGKFFRPAIGGRQRSPNKGEGMRKGWLGGQPVPRPSSQPAEAEEASGGRVKSKDAQSAGSESRRLKPEH